MEWIPVVTIILGILMFVFVVIKKWLAWDNKRQSKKEFFDDALYGKPHPNYPLPGFGLRGIISAIVVTIFLIGAIPLMSWNWPAWTVFVLPCVAFFGFLWKATGKLWIALIVSTTILSMIFLSK